MAPVLRTRRVIGSRSPAEKASPQVKKAPRGRGKKTPEVKVLPPVGVGSGIGARAAADKKGQGKGKVNCAKKKGRGRVGTKKLVISEENQEKEEGQEDKIMAPSGGLSANNGVGAGREEEGTSSPVPELVCFLFQVVKLFSSVSVNICTAIILQNGFLENILVDFHA